MTQKNLKSARVVFWIRMLSWLGIGCGVPIGVFAYKFGLFRVSAPAVDSLGNPIVHSNVSLNGWGILCVLLVGSYLINIVKEIADAHAGYSLMKQCYKGFVKLIPLIMGYAICFFLKDAIDQIMFCLLVLIVCRAVSIPINPLPKWKYEVRGSEDYSDILESFTNFVKSFKKGGGS